MKATTRKEAALKETNFSETSFPNDNKEPRNGSPEVAGVRSVNTFPTAIVGAKSFEMYCAGLCDPYDYVSWYCGLWWDCLLRAAFTRIHIKFGNTEAPPKRWKRRHVATSQLLVARCRHFKSIKVANNFMHLWPLCYTDLTGYPQKQANGSKLILKRWCQQCWFLRGRLLVRIGSATYFCQKGHIKTFFDSSWKVLWTNWYCKWGV